MRTKAVTFAMVVNEDIHNSAPARARDGTNDIVTAGGRGTKERSVLSATGRSASPTGVARTMLGPFKNA